MSKVNEQSNEGKSGFKAPKQSREEKLAGLRGKVKEEKEAGNPYAKQIKERPSREKNLTVGVTKPELEFLSSQMNLTLASKLYLDSNHNGRQSTSVGNEASNIVRLIMDLSHQIGSDDYRKWLPSLVEEFIAKDSSKDKE